MTVDSHRIYRLLEGLREELADLMLEALTKEGHIVFSSEEYARLKGELMQLLIGRVRA